MAAHKAPNPRDPPWAPLLRPLSSTLSSVLATTPEHDPVAGRGLVPARALEFLHASGNPHPVLDCLQVLDHVVHDPLLLYQHALRLGLLVLLM